jgi:hypothetical protein
MISIKAVFVLMFLFGLTFYKAYVGFSYPAMNFDFFMYVGVTHTFFGDPTVTSLDFVKEVARIELPQLKEDSYFADAYRTEVWSNAGAFSKQLSYYTIKPIYPIFMKGLTLIGFDYLSASVLISSTSYFLIIILSWLCISHSTDHNDIVPMFCAAAIASFFPLTGLTRFSTPDLLNTAFIMLSVYLVLCKGFWTLGFLFAIFAIFIRPDSVVWALALSAYYGLSRDRGFRNVVTAVALGAFAYMAYKSIGMIDKSYPILLVQKIFFNPLTAASAHPETVTGIYDLNEIFQRYFDHTWLVIVGFDNKSQFALFFVLLAISGAIASFRREGIEGAFWFAGPLFVIVIFHLAMPKEHDRNIIYTYIIVLCGWMRIFASARLEKS